MSAALASTTRTVLRLRGDATLSGDQGLEITGPFCVLRFRDLTEALRGALAKLAEAEHAQDDLTVQVVSRDGFGGMPRLQAVLKRLDTEGLLEHTVLLDGVPFARLRPVGRGSITSRPAPAADVAIKLSRFAFAQAEGGLLVVRAPGNHLALELAPAAAGLLGALAEWTSLDALTGTGAEGVGVPAEAVSEALRLFDGADLLVRGGADEDPQSVRQSAAQWSAAELMLHARSRGSKTVAGYGGTYPTADRFAPLPASPPPREGRRVALPKPDLATVSGRDPSLTEALETRRSIREHDAEHPITLEQLGELLYRCARRRQTFNGEGQELADRPYPSGGAVHELEIYPLITTCAGVDPGLWHYRTDSHELELVTDPGPATAALVDAARAGSMMGADPQVVLLVSARFGRVMWKYETIGYSLILKNLGVLYQTIYLVATAMGLAACGLGGGDAADFAAATGLDYLAEGSVGELVLGSRPAVLSNALGMPATPAQAPA